MQETKKKIIRCAIYTRKSCEEGLEQEFNSLDAQREACESYIKSQQHEGWICVEKQYNDGGFSGGTLERPALRELFQDIEDGKVDTVVVYKIDRLTRSLMDFSKIVEIFDKRSVTFVSITQQFNTTTSMGRLTLNILLSFAQFEREVTGERIRDKIAASKKKGMWMNGKAPIGYKLEERKLVVDKTNAALVRNVFNKYLELKSVPDLIGYLKENDIKTLRNKPFTKGPLYHLLQNKTYIGLIKHKENCYKGEHQAIIDNEVFEEVQNLLSKNRISKKCAAGSKNPSLLAGKIFDDKSNYMSPSHSNTRNRKYRYYVSQAITQFRKQEAGSVSKIPAREIENFVITELSEFIFNRGKIQQYIKDFDVNKQKDILDSLKNIKLSLKSTLDSRFIRVVIAKIILSKENVEIIVCKKQLIKALEAITYGTNFPEEVKEETTAPINLFKEISLQQTANKCSWIIISDSRKQEINVNSKLLKAVTKSFYWNNLLLSGEVENSIDIQKLEGLNDNKNIKNILKLRFLAPDIIEKILNGTQPQDLTVQKLVSINTLDWKQQRELLNI